MPALLSDSWWAPLGPIVGILLTSFRAFRVRSIRAQLASLQKAGDGVANQLENGLDDFRQAQRQRYEPTPIWTQAFESLIGWQDQADRYLRDTPELGAEYVDRFDLHPEELTRSLKPIERTEAAIPQVREKQRRLSMFHDEIK